MEPVLVRLSVWSALTMLTLRLDFATSGANVHAFKNSSSFTFMAFCSFVMLDS